MSRETEWVQAVKAQIEPVFASSGLTVRTGHRLPYAIHVSHYDDAVPSTKNHGYQTDLLISEHSDAKWIARVVVEFKLGQVTTHDVLTYSAKAATHKALHPYLRYGIVIGGFRGSIPQRLIRHGQHFDFMLTLESDPPSGSDCERLVRLLQEEVEASKVLSNLVARKSSIRLLHKKLVFSL